MIDQQDSIAALIAGGATYETLRTVATEVAGDGEKDTADQKR
ncbi:hypothetical protein [Streptomyces canus]